MNEFSHDGFWFTPGNEHEMQSGTLTVSSETGAQLSILGSLGPSGALVANDNFPTIPIVLGMAKGTRLTLERVRLVSSAMPAPGFISTTYRCRSVIVGEHLADEGAFETAQVTGSLSSLGAWSGISGLSMTVAQRADGQMLEFTQAYKYPDFVTGTSDGTDFSIESMVATHIDNQNYEYEMRESHHVRWRSETPRSLVQWVSDVLIPWSAMLAIATRGKTGFLELNAYYPSQTPNTSDGLRSCKLYHSEVPWGAHTNEGINPPEMLFSHGDIRDQLPIIISKMRQITDDRHALKNLYLSVRPQSSYLVEEHCFRAARALESYHRFRIQLDEIDPEEFERQIELAKAALPNDMMADIREWALQKLSYPFEPSFRARLKAMVLDWQNILEPLLPTRRMRSAFINYVIANRNCQAHGGQEACGAAPTSYDLVFTTTVLSLIAEAYLLKELSLTPSAIAEIVTSKEWYQQLLTLRARTEHFS